MSAARRAIIVGTILALAVATAPVARGLDGSDALDACHANVGGVPVAGIRACRTAQAVVYGLARACRETGPPETCAIVDGRLVSGTLVDAYEGSWVPRALALQRGLDDAAPLQEELWAHTHNSFNAEAYDATLSGLDPNQVYSITEQLRMGIRAIEIDVHWAPSLEGPPEDGLMAPIACHGEPVPIGPVVVHFGCTLEVHVRARLAEVRAWLDRPENAGEVLMIYLENNMDDSALAHQRATEAIEETLGSLVYRPAVDGACNALPMDTSRAAIRAAGKRVLLVGNCGPGPWTSYVFERGPRWIESSSPVGVDYPDYPACVAAERGPPDNYAQNWIRWWGDGTWVGAMVEGTGLGGRADIPAEEAARMVRCGVNMPGFDQLHPFDPRLEALVWSWAPEEPAGTTEGTCAYAGADGRFRSSPCGAERAFACATAGAWSVTAATGSWSDGATACPAGTAFSVPTGGYENELLKVAKGTTEVWLDYRVAGGTWTPETAA